MITDDQYDNAVDVCGDTYICGMMEKWRIYNDFLDCWNFYGL